MKLLKAERRKLVKNEREEKVESKRFNGVLILLMWGDLIKYEPVLLKVVVRKRQQKYPQRVSRTG